MNKEEIYDKEIAPKLLEVCHLAQERGIYFLACVDISNEDQPIATAQTRFIDLDKAHPAMRLVSRAISAKGNVDSLFLTLRKDAKANGHNSIYFYFLDRVLSR